MHLIEGRRHIKASDEIWLEAPAVASALDAETEFLPGIWRDGDYYLIGLSTSDEAPQEVAFVLTKREWRQRQRGKLPQDFETTKKHIRRAQRLYPNLSVL